MKLAIVTFNFDSGRHSGVNRVVSELHQMLKELIHAEIDIVSFYNDSKNVNSISLLRPKIFHTTLVKEDGWFQNSKIIRIGSIGSELEVLRYRKRVELKDYFERYSVIFVVTGIMQFANVIPNLQIPVFVQCATRLKWERKSQYPSMSRFKRLILKMQLPILANQEYRVLKSGSIILVENSRMNEWIESKGFIKHEIWYPAVKVLSKDSKLKYSPSINGHFVSVGRLNDARKGWKRLFLAYKEAYDSNPQIPSLVVVGGGEFSDKVQEIVDELVGSYPINIMRNASDFDRDRVLTSSSYFLQASYEEGLGLAALEALSFGVPLICSETDGSREYVLDGKSGKLVRQGKRFIQEFSEAILSSQSWNYKYLHTSSKEIFASKFSYEVSLQQLHEILKKNGIY